MLEDARAAWAERRDLFLDRVEELKKAREAGLTLAPMESPVATASSSFLDALQKSVEASVGLKPRRAFGEADGQQPARKPPAKVEDKQPEKKQRKRG